MATEAEIIAKYEAWVNSLPVFARDEVYLNYEGKWWSPNDVLVAMKQGTPEGKHFIEAEEKLEQESP
jgi:hypothetical protein